MLNGADRAHARTRDASQLLRRAVYDWLAHAPL